MRIAIGIPTYNRASVLLSTIREALQQNRPADEIVIVDQSDWYPEGSKDELLALAQKGAIRYFRQQEANLPKARNRILDECACDIIIFIDDDVQLTPDFVESHLANYQDDSVSAVCGRVTESDILISPVVARTWPRFLDYKFFDLGWSHRIGDFGTVKGCNHSVRRETVLALKGYDEAFAGVALREETDIAFRILQARGTICFDPLAYLHHLRVPSGGCRVNVWGDWTAGCCVLRFAVKHRNQLGWYFLSEIWHGYRLSVLNKRNICRPRLIILRSMAYAYCIMYLFLRGG